MALIENDLFKGEINKVQIAIERLKTFEPKEGYYLAFSGGKDSVTIKALSDMALVKYDAHYNVTTIDPPELVRFIREYHQNVSFDRPERPFLKELTIKGFPLRQNRWCCEKYKERGGKGRLVLTGVRWAESNKRKQRKLVEHCFKDKSKKYLNVIIDWSDKEVWEFIHKYKIPYCSLYEEGFKRLGCVLCPMASNSRRKEAERWPKFVKAYKRAFEILWQKGKDRPSFKRWKNSEEMFEWWMNPNPNQMGNPDQTIMFE